MSRSFIVTRTNDGSIKAHFNACLHRGTKLKPSGTAGYAADLKCPFHGWTWNLDGTNKKVLCPWDFPHADPDKLTLPEATAGMPRIAKNFARIDKDKKGFVTLEQIKSMMK